MQGSEFNDEQWRVLESEVVEFLMGAGDSGERMTSMHEADDATPEDRRACVQADFLLNQAHRRNDLFGG